MKSQLLHDERMMKIENYCLANNIVIGKKMIRNRVFM
jgi:hypothetical protein